MSVTPATAARQGDAAALALALQASRADTLATFAAYERRAAGPASAAAARAEPAAVGAGPHRLVPGVLAGAQPAARARAGAPTPTATARAARADADALYDSSRVRTTAAGGCPARRGRHARDLRPSCEARWLLDRTPETTTRCTSSACAAARGHAPRSRAVHGAGAGHRDRRRALAAAAAARAGHRACASGRALALGSAASAASPSTTSAGRARGATAGHATSTPGAALGRLPALRRGRRLPRRALVDRGRASAGAAPGSRLRRATCVRRGMARGMAAAWRHGRWQALDRPTPPAT
jgi:hypothetical protein